LFEIKHTDVHRRDSVKSIQCPKMLSLKGRKFRRDEFNLEEAEMGMR